MRDPANPDLLEDLRFALAVLEERSHLGLDDEIANTIRTAIHHQIANAESTLQRKPVASVPVETVDKSLSA